MGLFRQEAQAIVQHLADPCGAGGIGGGLLGGNKLKAAVGGPSVAPW